MNSSRRRTALMLAICLALVAGSAGAWMTLGWSFTTNVLTLLTAATGITAFLMEMGRRQQESAELDDVANVLALAVQRQWEEANEREGLSELLPVRFAVESAEAVTAKWTELLRFRRVLVDRKSLDVTVATNSQTLRSKLADIARVFAQVPGGRLVLLGPGGAGKSMLARQLTLCLLRDRQPEDPVPLLVQLSSWEPSTERFASWLEGQLAGALESVGMFGRRQRQEVARQLITGHRTTPVLDGLDEMSESLRVAAMEGLNRSPAAQDQLVVTCRSEEYRQAVQAGERLLGADVVEIQPLAPADVAAYLRAPGGRVAARWEPVVDRLDKSAGPLVDVLTTPLFVTLARAVYDPRTHAQARRFFHRVDIDRKDDVPDPRDLLDTKKFPNGDALKEHLLGAFVTAAYRGEDPDGRRSRWSVAQAQRWHTALACLLTERDSTDLAWWELWRETPRGLRSLAFGLAAGLTVWVGSMPLTLSSPGVTVPAAALEALVPGVLSAVAATWAAGTRVGRPPAHPQEGVGEQPAQVLPVLVAGLIGSIVVGTLFRLMLASGSAFLDVSASAALVLALVLGGGFVAGLLSGALLLRLFAAGEVRLEEIVNPRKVLARDRMVFIVFGLVGWPLVVVAAALVTTMMWAVLGVSTSSRGVDLGLAVFLAGLGLYGIGLVWGWSRASWAFFALARAWLAARGRLPWRLMAFLDDASRRGVLRQVGPYYRFRHGDLQGYLAEGRTRPVRVEHPDPMAMIAAVRRWRVDQSSRLVPPAPVRHPGHATPMTACAVRGEYYSDVTAAGQGAGVQLTVAQAFERAHRRLLIAGDPGSGKTTLALELIEHLLAQAAVESGAGVPELFSLASWPRRQGSLADWLEDELRQRGLDAGWLREGRLIPVLDGLDEVDEHYRGACLEAINDYIDGHAVVVSCRLDEYRRLVADRPAPPLGGCYITQPLDVPEIVAALRVAARDNPAWEPVCEAVARGDAAPLRQLWRNPLLLRVAILGYRAGDPGELLHESTPAHRVWDTFIETAHTAAGPYPAQRVRRWLGWLAAPAAQRGEIWLHRLEPPPSRFGSPRRAQALASGIVCGVLVSLGPALLTGMHRTIGMGRPAHWPGLMAISVLTYGLLFGAAGGLVPAFTYVCGPIRCARRLACGLVYGLTFWLAQALTTEVSARLLDPGGEPTRTLPSWLPAAAFGLLVARVGGISADPGYAPAWSTRLLSHGLRAGLIAGLLVGLVMADMVSPPATLAAALCAAVIVTVITGLARAVPVSGPPVDQPTSWTISAARSGAVFGAFTAAALALAYILYIIFGTLVFGGWQTGKVVAWALACAVFGLTSAGAVFGWAALGWNAMLLLRCRTRDLLPARPVAFLQWCTGRGYVQRSGGCYRWAHAALAEHLAAVSGHRAVLPATTPASPAPWNGARALRDFRPRAALRLGAPGPRRPMVIGLVLVALTLVFLVGSLTLTSIQGMRRDDAVLTLRGHAGVVRAVAVTPNGRQIVTGSTDTTVRVWDRASGRVVRRLNGHAHSVAAVVVTPDGRQSISSSFDNTVRVWDLTTGRQVRVLGGDPVYVYALAITLNGRQVIGGAVDGTVRVWDLASGRVIRTLRGHGSEVVGGEPDDAVMAVAVTPDGRQVLSAGQDKTIRVWDLATAQQVHVLRGHTYWVHALTVTPDGRAAVSGDFDRVIRVWDLATGQQLSVLNGHVAPIRAVAVAPDGRTLVSCSDDRTVRVWDLANSVLLRTLRGHSGIVNALAITPDGSLAVSASDDTTVRIWALRAKG